MGHGDAIDIVNSNPFRSILLSDPSAFDIFKLYDPRCELKWEEQQQRPRRAQSEPSSGQDHAAAAQSLQGDTRWRAI